MRRKPCHQASAISKRKTLFVCEQILRLHNRLVHESDDYAMFDSIVSEKLKQFKKAYPNKFAQFKNKDFGLENYGKYKQILENFRADFRWIARCARLIGIFGG